jgi:Tfp pilus assembly protein PilZ
MQEKRRHERLKLDVVELHGKMSLAEKVEIIDISLGGVSLKADRRLNIGKEILLKLQERGASVDLKGVVVRSELSGIEENAAGERVAVYAAGLMFKDDQTNKIVTFFNSIMQGMQKDVSAGVDRRLNVRFQIIDPQEKILGLPSQFKVKVISPGGMLIQTDHALDVESTVPMSLSLSADKAVNFIGRVASCQLIEMHGQPQYEIGVAFGELTDQDRKLITLFIDYMGALQEDEGAVSAK